VGSLIIGLVLVGVAVFLAVEVKSLLVGESADPEIEKATRDVVREHAKLSEVLNIITVQQGPGEVLVALKIRLAPGLSCEEACGAINAFEVALKAKRPEVRWLFVEPDVLK
jgi:divalent metal cation (Fe/Co/Zn/Cd) transporter